MKYAVVLLLTAVAWAAEDQSYTTYWDTVNIEEILSNDRLLKNYVDCVLEKGKCTPDGIKLKSGMVAIINHYGPKLEMIHLVKGFFKQYLVENRKREIQTAFTADYKNSLPAAIKDECSKCNDHQRKQAIRVIKFIINKKPDYWKELSAKFDPTGSFYKKYEKELTE